MTPEQLRALNRQQLTDILKQLADRAKETNEPALAGILYITAASVAEGTEILVAALLAEYVQARFGSQFGSEEQD